MHSLSRRDYWLFKHSVNETQKPPVNYAKVKPNEIDNPKGPVETESTFLSNNLSMVTDEIQCIRVGPYNSQLNEPGKTDSLNSLNSITL